MRGFILAVLIAFSLPSWAGDPYLTRAVILALDLESAHRMESLETHGFAVVDLSSRRIGPVVARYRERYRGVPIWLVASGMQGEQAVKFVVQNPGMVQGLVFTDPADSVSLADTWNLRIPILVQTHYPLPCGLDPDSGCRLYQQAQRLTTAKTRLDRVNSYGSTAGSVQDFIVNY